MCVMYGAIASARLMATVEVGATVQCGAACTLTFAPIGASMTVVNGSFSAAVPGDYVTKSNCRYRAIVFPQRMGTSDALRFSDGFQRLGVNSASDSSVGIWNAARCAANGPRGLTFSGHACSIETTHAVPSMFAEPLTLTLSGVMLPAAATLVVSLGELVVNAATRAGTLVVTAENAPACSFMVGCRANAQFSIAISANAENCSISATCGTETTHAAGTAWNGRGAAHGLHCRDTLIDALSGAPYDCGRGALRLASTGASGVAVRSLALRSCLIPGNDPLRPGVEVPVYPAVLAGITDEIGWSSPDLGAAQPRAAEGIVDVSAPPFGADRSGARDATRAIQSAVDYARENYAVVYFPPGTYTVSDSIVLRSLPRMMATGHIPGPFPAGGSSDDFLLDGVSSRYVPNVLVGSSRSEEAAGGDAHGATIVLAPRTFTNASAPRYVLDFFFENSAGTPEPNAQYNSIAMNLNIVVSEGNVGDVGVRLRGAQGSGLEDVTVDVGDGLAGIVGGCGSGGAHHGLTVIGGRYGLDLRQSQPTATVILFYLPFTFMRILLTI